MRIRVLACGLLIGAVACSQQQPNGEIYDALSDQFDENSRSELKEISIRFDEYVNEIRNGSELTNIAQVNLRVQILDGLLAFFLKQKGNQATLFQKYAEFKEKLFHEMAEKISKEVFEEIENTVKNWTEGESSSLMGYYKDLLKMKPATAMPVFEATAT